ncbi:MAG: hypothetical protein R6U27_12100 [Desulfobacterales bacterium]
MGFDIHPDLSPERAPHWINRVYKGRGNIESILCNALSGLKRTAFLSDKNNMYINAQPSTFLMTAMQPELSMHQGTESQPLKLLPFQIIRATVAEKGLDEVVLNLKQLRLTARTKVPLKSGQNLNLQVISTHPQIQLKIVEETELKHLLRLLHLLHQNIRLTQLFDQLQNTNTHGFEPFSENMQNLLKDLLILLQSNPGHLTGNNLSALCNQLGLGFEALLSAGAKKEARNTLKSALLIYAGKCQQEEKSFENIDHVLNQLKLYQLCRCRLAQEDAVFVPLPFSFLEQGYLIAEQWEHFDKDSGKIQKFWKINLNLKLSLLGNLQILLLCENLDLRMRILCDSDEKVGIISKSLNRLKDNLTTVSLLSFSVGTGAEDPGRYLVRRLTPDKENILSTEV